MAGLFRPGEHFHDVSIGVEAEDLQAAIRPMPGFALHFDPVGLQRGGHDGCIGYFERIVESAAGTHVFGWGRKTRRSTSRVGQNQVNLLVADLKPRAGKIESRPLDNAHAQQVAVKSAATFQIGYDQRHVIDSRYLQSRHGKILREWHNRATPDSSVAVRLRKDAAPAVARRTEWGHDPQEHLR